MYGIKTINYILKKDAVTNESYFPRPPRIKDNKSVKLTITPFGAPLLSDF